MVFPFKTFALSTLYAFLSANLVGLALNLFSGILLSDNTPCPKAVAVYTACTLFSVGSLFFFFVAWLLEDARNDWLAENAPREPAKRDFHVETRKFRLLICLILAVVCTAMACVSLAIPYNPVSGWIEYFTCPIPTL